MTIANLIKELQKYPENLIVRDEFNDEICSISNITNKYYGEYIMLRSSWTTPKELVLWEEK